MAEVTLKNVEKVYPGSVKAVSDFSLEIADGELLVLVGPSGCGKSTTLRMIAGLEEVSAGTISIGGRVVNDVAPKDRDVAMVFQNYALYPHMTVYDNMAFGLKLRKYPKKEIKRQVEEAAGILNLTRLLHRRPQALSGGERQRVAVGRAIVRKPSVFLFDEPLSNLDARLRVQMRVEISRLHARLGATMIYVTHDQMEAMTMGDRIVVIKEGFIQQVADPVTLYDSPTNKFVAGFIGMPPMNFFRGTIERRDGSLVFNATRGFSLPVADSQKEAAAALLNQPVTLGIRPEDIGAQAAELQPNAPRIRAAVELVEPLGAESYVYLKVGPDTLVSRADSQQRFTVGTEVDLAVNIDKVHFFDSQTEATLRTSDFGVRL